MGDQFLTCPRCTRRNSHRSRCLARRCARSILLAIVALCVCRRAPAQATSDRVAAARTLTAAESVKAEVEESRYHLGPIRLIPFIAVSNAGYNNNIFNSTAGKVGDYTATLAAGTRFVLPVGAKVFVRGVAAPEYVWYLRHPEGRAWGRTLEGDVLGFFNRATIDAGGIDTKTPSILNAETFQNVLTTTEGGRGRLDVTIAGSLGVFAQGETTKYSFEATPPSPPGLSDPALLDRNEVLARGGLQWSRGEMASVAVFAEQVRTTFDHVPERGDNRSIAYGVGLTVRRHRIFVNLSAAYRDTKPIDGSSFRPFSTMTGSYYLSYFLRPTVELFANGNRGLQYSLTDANPYYLATSNGGGFSIGFPHRIFLRGFGSYGENRYPIPVSGLRRLDKIVEWGGGIQFAASRRLSVGVLAYQDRYNSNVPGVSRTYFRVASLVTLELGSGLSIQGAFS